MAAVGKSNGRPARAGKNNRLEVAKIFKLIWGDDALPENCELCRIQVGIKAERVTLVDSRASAL